MNKKLNNLIYICTVIISVFVIVSIISIGIFTWPKADDFSSLNQINKIGIIQHIIKVYNEWDGRVFVGVIHAILIKYLPVEIINSIWACCLVLTSFVSLKIFLYLSRINRKIKISDHIIGTAIFSSILWYGFKSHISDTVYWATGGVYILAFLFAVIWLYLWITKFSFERTIRSLHKILFYLFTIYIGALTQNLSCAVLAYMGVEMIKAILKKDTIVMKRTLLTILLLITGLLAIVLAPGNFIRSAYGPKSFIMNFSVIGMNYIKTSVYFTWWSLTLFMLLFISVPLIIIFLICSTHYELKKKIVIKLKQEYSISLDTATIRQVMTKILTLFQFLFAAFASVLPFALLPDFINTRTSIYFMGFIFFWTYFEIVPFSLRHIMRQTVHKTTSPSHRPYMLIIIFLLCTLSVVSTHIVNLSRIKKEVIRREKIIETYSNKNVDVVTYPIDKTKLPFSYTFSDIASDKDNWINQAVAATYKVKSIRTDINLISRP